MKLYREEEKDNVGGYVILWILGMVAVSIFAVIYHS